jgi:hypothetical protein
MAGWIVLIFLVLVILGYLFVGIEWLFENELVWVIVGLSIIGAAILFFVIAAGSAIFLPDGEASTASRDIEAMRSAETKANQAITTLKKDRAVLERKSRELEELRLSVRGSINFQMLAQRHHESRLMADGWHRHKREAILSKKDLSTGIRRLDGHIRQSNSRLSRESEAAHSTVSRLSGLARTLQSEIDRSGGALDEYNQQTADLRDHIWHSCGDRGVKWYNDLQARKNTRRSIDD